MVTMNKCVIALSALLSLGLTTMAVQAYTPNHGNDTLYNAVNKDDYTRVSSLLNQGANPNGSSREGTLLHTAVLNNNVESVRVLLERGANPNMANNNGITPLYDAVSRDQVAIVQLLLNHGANPNMASKNVTPLHKAIERDRVALVRLLLERGANPNVRDSYGMAPLEYAKKHNQTGIQQLLLQFGGGSQAYTAPQPSGLPSRYHNGTSY